MNNPKLSADAFVEKMASLPYGYFVVEDHKKWHEDHLAAMKELSKTQEVNDLFCYFEGPNKNNEFVRGNKMLTGKIRRNLKKQLMTNDKYWCKYCKQDKDLRAPAGRDIFYYCDFQAEQLTTQTFVFVESSADVPCLSGDWERCLFNATIRDQV